MFQEVAHMQKVIIDRFRMIPFCCDREPVSLAATEPALSDRRPWCTIDRPDPPAPLVDHLPGRHMHRSAYLPYWFVATSALAQAQAPNGPYPRPPGQYEVDVERSTMVSMRDGVRLSTDVYRPKGVSGPLPTILIRLPYNKATYRAATVPAEYFASHGYAVAVQDVRGKFASEGQYKVYEAT